MATRRSPPFNVVLRADAGPVVGYGHLVRSLALGDALVARGARCILVTRPPGGGFTLPVPADRVELGPDVSPGREAEEIRALGDVSWVIADLREADDARLSLLRGPGRLGAIDDEGARLRSVDLVVCPNIGVPAGPANEGTELLSGAPYVLLRSAFARATPRRVEPTLRKIVVCLGGADAADVTRRLLDALLDVLPATVESVSVITGAPDALAGVQSGAGARRRDVVRALSRLDAKALADELRAADLGVLAAGTLLYEAGALGLPALWVSINAAQAREADAMERIGGGIHAGAPATLTPRGLAGSLARLATAEARALAAERAQAAIDGAGADRVAARIVAMHARAADGEAT